MRGSVLALLREGSPGRGLRFALSRPAELPASATWTIASEHSTPGSLWVLPSPTRPATIGAQRGTKLFELTSIHFRQLFATGVSKLDAE